MGPQREAPPAEAKQLIPGRHRSQREAEGRPKAKSCQRGPAEKRDKTGPGDCSPCLHWWTLPRLSE